MGKTNHGSKTQKQKSEQQLPNMSTFKQRKNTKKRQRKKRRSIQKLYDHLQQNCNGPPEEIELATPNSSLFYIDTVPSDTLYGSFSTENTPKYFKQKIKDMLIENGPQKCRIGMEKNKNIEMIDITKRPKLDNSCIIINDDDDKSTTRLDFETPSKHFNKVHCSTPLTSKKILQKPSDSNISRISNNNAESDTVNSQVDLTKDINQSSFLTIDLTADTTVSKSNATVIDLVNSSDIPECSFVSMSNTSVSISEKSDDTVIENIHSKRSEDRLLKSFKKRMANLPTRQKGKILDFIAKEMFNGCDFNGGGLQLKQKKTCATDTAEDTYIKEMILGQTRSRNSIGSNVYNPLEDFKKKSGLRMIIIDGSNVAMEHGKGKLFSVTGLKICIDYFLKRGHTVKAFVPRFRCKYNKSTSPQLLQELANRGYVLFTPSREIQGRLITSYDDRYIVQTAAESDGVIVSGDNFRDLLRENPRWQHVIENRLLPFTWVDNLLMFPRDPLGRNGPTLEQFLRHP